MKKTLSLIIMAVMIISVALSLSACGWDGTVTFDGNGGTLADGQESVKVTVDDTGTITNSPAFVREGYSLLGYDHFLDNIGESMTIKAVWAKTSVGLEYTLNADGSSYSCSGVGTCTDTDIVIASTYEGKPVTVVTARFPDAKKVTVPYGVKELGAAMFAKNTNIETVVLPETISELPSAFAPHAENLKTIYLPKSLENIVDAVFYNTGLQNVYYGGSEEDWENIEIHATNTSLEGPAFTYNYNYCANN